MKFVTFTLRRYKVEDLPMQGTDFDKIFLWPCVFYWFANLDWDTSILWFSNFNKINVLTFRAGYLSNYLNVISFTSKRFRKSQRKSNKIFGRTFPELQMRESRKGWPFGDTRFIGSPDQRAGRCDLRRLSYYKPHARNRLLWWKGNANRWRHLGVFFKRW